MKTHLATHICPDQPRGHHHQQAGFSLVEVMVALVVLAVGMLGIASLYVTTLRSSGSAISRMHAVNLASDLADRIRANRFARTAYENATPTIKDCIGSTKNCSPADMAENDLYLWQLQIDDLLPGKEAETRGKVVYAAGAANAPDDYTITVFWKEKGGDGNNDAADVLDDELSYILTMQVEP